MIPNPFSLFFEINLKKKLHLDILLLYLTNSIDNFVIHDQNQSSTSSTKNISQCSLEESTWSLLLEDLTKAITHTIVYLLFLRFGCFNLHTTLQGIQGICNNSRKRNGNLCNSEFGRKCDGRKIFLVRIERLQNILDTELCSTVNNNSNRRGTNTVVKRHESICFHSLLNTISHTIELLLFPEVGSKNSSDVDKRVYKGVGSSSSKGT